MFPPIDQMKLQKLLFYAHAWHLAMNGAPLFDDDFEAWPWGPVVRDIYFQTREFGRMPITTKITELRRVGNGPLDFKFFTPQGVDAGPVKAFIRAVWDSHKQYTGVQLSNSTHAQGEPWTILHDQYGSLDHKPKIPNELIQAVFQGKMRNADTNSAPA